MGDWNSCSLRAPCAEPRHSRAPNGSQRTAKQASMLSYRHGFHAGNHADVLKHFVWVQLLLHMTRKDKPLWVIDTHAGAGCYSLEQGYATRNAESSACGPKGLSPSRLPSTWHRSAR
jgi:hypothetical protein